MLVNMKLFYIDRQPVGVFPIFIVPKQRSKFSLLREILSNATISSTTLLFHFTFRSPACVRASVALETEKYIAGSSSVQQTIGTIQKQENLFLYQILACARVKRRLQPPKPQK